MTSATAQVFGQGDEEGAHLLFSGNGRRWIDLAGDGHGPITMGILPGGLWVEASDADLRAKDKEGLVNLAKAIGVAQEEDLASPHIMALFDQMAPTLVKGMAEPFEAPAIARPTLTSQGAFTRHLIEGGDPIRMTQFNLGGRSTDPGVCFALSSFKDELRYNLLFDERFFVQDDVVQLGYAVAGLFRTLLVEEEPRRAKL